MRPTGPTGSTGPIRPTGPMSDAESDYTVINIPFGDLKRHYQTIKHEIDRAIAGVLESGWFILGKQVERFEEEFAAFCGLPYGAGVNSGTDALYLALLACGVKEGDEVIIVPNTAVPTVCAIRMAGATPVFCDVRPDTLVMDPALIEDRVTPKTKAIVPVHLYGRMCDMDSIIQVAQAHGLKVVEDACQAHGAEWNGLKSGNLGDAACYSFYPSKNLGAFGDGGMVVTKDAAIYKKVKMLRNYGKQDRDHNAVEGINSRLDELQAAVLRAKLSHLDAWNDRRRRIADRYGTGVINRAVALPEEGASEKHVYHLYVVQTSHREDLQRHMQERGIQTVVHYPLPVYKQPAYRRYDVAGNRCPVAEQASDRILSLPVYPELTDEEVDHVIDSLNAWEAED